MKVAKSLFLSTTIKANDFDIKRAYNEIKPFKEIVLKAEKMVKELFL
jgi:hypothetical protein